MATYAIGDIQGCYDGLQRLLEHVDFNPSDDYLWLVGDIINRGPHSLKTLRFIKALDSRATMVLGNHEIYALAAFHNIVSHDPNNTFYEIFKAANCDELLHWLRHRPLAHFDASHNALMVHAGVPPIWSLNETLGYSKELEEALRSDDYVTLIREVFGNHPTEWTENLQGWRRYRYLIDGLTRIRFCTPQGTLDVKTKGGLDDAPTGYYPWFHCPQRKPIEADIVFGHWSTLGGYIENNLYGLDTGYIWGGSLTALRLEDKKVFQISAQT